MTCRPCAFIDQALCNLAWWADISLNLALGGDPHETVSSRIARARRDGGATVRRFAMALCVVLTLGGNIVRRLRGLGPQDHCAYALDGSPSIAREIVHPSPEPRA